jgi:type IV fimbrial biogenesis protein FimT
LLADEEGRFVLTTTPKSAGFTLIELMITIAIFSITLTFGISSYRTWVQNTQIRNAAESIMNGIQRARAEAVKRNTSVAFDLSADSSWQISVAGSGVIETRSSSEGSKNVTVTPTPTGATTITLNSLGVVVPNADSSAPLTQVNLSATSAAAGGRAMRVTIGMGGIVRMCDPNLATGSNPQAC